MWGQNAIPTLYMVEANVIPARQFKDANYMWGQNAIPTL
jgi:hypothetical protein